MLQAYIDDSGWDGKSPVFVLAGYIANAEQWERFSDDWQTVLDLNQPRSIKYLKMKEACRLGDRNSQFFQWSGRDRDERLKQLIFAINRHVQHGIISVIPIEPYVRLFKGMFNPSALDRPYFLSFFGIMARLLRLTRQLSLDDRIEFVFDTQGNESVALLTVEYEKFIALAPPELQGLSGGPPTFRKDEEARPLQAADMIAWHARRYYYDLYSGKDPTKEPSNVFFAHMCNLTHDVVDVWTEEKLRGAAEAVGAARRTLGSWSGIKMTLPDPSSPLS
jgi:hypothetical protein